MKTGYEVDGARLAELLRQERFWAREQAQHDKPGTSGLYYWTGYGDALAVAVHLLETGVLQRPLPHA